MYVKKNKGMLKNLINFSDLLPKLFDLRKLNLAAFTPCLHFSQFAFLPGHQTLPLLPFSSDHTIVLMFFFNDPFFTSIQERVGVFDKRLVQKRAYLTRSGPFKLVLGFFLGRAVCWCVF